MFRHTQFLRLFLLVILGLCLPQMASAQLGRWGSDSEPDLDTLIKSGRFSPFIEANYGLAKPRFEGYEGSFNTLGVMELKLGFTALDSVRAALVSLDDRYAFVSFIGQDIRPSGEADEGEIGSELARFGFGNRLGYGYGRKGLTFEMYNQNSLNWTKLTPLEYDGMDPEAQAIFDRYENSFRFGQLMEAGVKVHVIRSLAISAEVEGAVIFPRTVFWPWLGSAMIYSGVQGALQYFSEAIVDTSPLIGPALDVLLNSAGS